MKDFFITTAGHGEAPPKTPRKKDSIPKEQPAEKKKK